MNKHRYINQRTMERTDRASVALQWHKNGDRVQVDTLNPSGSLRTSNVIDGAIQHTARDENRDHCKRIATELEKYENGNMYTCPECGSTVEMPDDVGDRFHCYHCHHVGDVDEYDQLLLYDFFSDVYDIEYRIGSDRELRSVQIMVACGGPNIYIDTASKAVELYWWTERASYPLLSSTVDAVNDWAEELYNI
jgi:ribosomal protein S27AE